MTAVIFRCIVVVSFGGREIVEEWWHPFVVTDVDGASEQKELFP
jgi:hypothetical protein